MSIYLVYGNQQSVNKADSINWNNNLLDYYGNSTDLWGLTLTPNEINSQIFSFVLYAESSCSGLTSCLACSTISDCIITVSHFQIKVFYTLLNTTGSQPIINLPTNQSSNGGAIAAGIIIPLLVIAIIVAVILFFLYRRKKQNELKSNKI